MLLKYEKPILLNIDGFDKTEGGCINGSGANGSCHTGTNAQHGSCMAGIFAGSICKNGNNASGKCNEDHNSSGVECIIGTDV